MHVRFNRKNARFHQTQQKLYVSFGKEPYKRDDILQKRGCLMKMSITAGSSNKSAITSHICICIYRYMYKCTCIYMLMYIHLYIQVYVYVSIHMYIGASTNT